MPETAPLFKSALTNSSPTAQRVPGFGSLQIDQVVPDAQQPRAEFVQEALSRLADSLREHAVEEARAYAALMELNGWTGKQVAKRLRVPASRVSRALALLRLPDDIRQRNDAKERWPSPTTRPASSKCSSSCVVSGRRRGCGVTV